MLEERFLGRFYKDNEAKWKELVDIAYTFDEKEEQRKQDEKARQEKEAQVNKSQT